MSDLTERSCWTCKWGKFADRPREHQTRAGACTFPLPMLPWPAEDYVGPPPLKVWHDVDYGKMCKVYQPKEP